MNFGGIDTPYSNLENAMFVVVPVPYDLTATYQPGARRGPSAILEASCNMELYDEETGKETYKVGVHTLSPIEADASSPKRMTKIIRDHIRRILLLNKIPVILGGEHSISIGAVEAMREKYPSLAVVHLDAHADMRDTYQGTRYSHACVGRRFLECAPVVQVGIRSMSAEEASFIKKHQVRAVSAGEIRNMKSWIKKVCAYLPEDVYVSMDLDVFDPSIMPATGTPEPGGLMWGEVTALLREISKRATIRGFDIVELCPIPGMVAPDFTAAKLTYRMMGYITDRHMPRKGMRT